MSSPGKDYNRPFQSLRVRRLSTASRHIRVICEWAYRGSHDVGECGTRETTKAPAHGVMRICREVVLHLAPALYDPSFALFYRRQKYQMRDSFRKGERIP